MALIRLRGSISECEVATKDRFKRLVGGDLTSSTTNSESARQVGPEGHVVVPVGLIH